jgi:hypothetical protein
MNILQSKQQQDLKRIIKQAKLVMIEILSGLAYTAP